MFSEGAYLSSRQFRESLSSYAKRNLFCGVNEQNDEKYFVQTLYRERAFGVFCDVDYFLFSISYGLYKMFLARRWNVHDSARSSIQST
jgi:hypothetical protein